MFKNVKKLVVSLLAGCSLLMVVGCGGDSDSNSGSSSSNLSTIDDSTQAVFGQSELSEDFRKSVIQLPDSFTATSATISQKSQKKSKDGSDHIALDVYGGIFDYVKISNQIKESLVESFLDIYKDDFLATVELDVKHTFDENGEFFSFKLEHPEGDYNWKLSLYNSVDVEPVAVSYFSKIEDNFKGKISLKYVDEIVMVVGEETTTLKKSGVINVVYDSNNDKKSLTIKAVADLSELVTFAQANWDSLSDNQKEELDLSSPEKLVVNITFENNEYSVGGTSYHGAGRTKTILDGEEFIFGDNNETYMFKAKSLANSDDGVKLAVALPDNQRSDVTNIFEDASISKVFQKGFINIINENVNRLLDDVDDNESEEEFVGNVDTELILGFKTLYWILGTNVPINTLEENGGVITQEDLDAAKLFWTNEPLEDIDLENLEGLNSFLTSTDEEITQEIKETIYYYILAPKVIEEYLAQNLSITIEDIQDMIARGSEEEVSFGDIFNTLLHIVNPAFFNEDNGFLGTYNGDKFFEFDSTGNKLTEGDKPAGFSALNVLDLDTIEDVSPKTVFDLVLTVQ